MPTALTRETLIIIMNTINDMQLYRLIFYS